MSFMDMYESNQTVVTFRIRLGWFEYMRAQRVHNANLQAMCELAENS